MLIDCYRHFRIDAVLAFEPVFHRPVLHSAEGLLAVRHFESAAIQRLFFHSLRPAVFALGIVTVQRNEDARRNTGERVDSVFEGSDLIDSKSSAFDLNDDFVFAVFGLAIQQAAAVYASVAAFDFVGNNADVSEV